VALEEDEVQLRFNLLSANMRFLKSLSFIRMVSRKKALGIYRRELFIKDMELGDFPGAIFSIPNDSNSDEVGRTRLCEILRNYIEKH